MTLFIPVVYNLFPLTIPAKGQIFLIYIITSVQKIVHVQTDG